MLHPEFFVITGPNAAGKSSFIRSRLNDFAGFEVIMTDVYKDRTKSIFDQAIVERKNIVFETVFNNSSFKNDRLSEEAYQIIINNTNFKTGN
ncbi:hypothetical protein OC25_13330 [Pedobacter kyungheensis]|uniref:UDP-N-acetylglucosamine kinase n=1 Tax=Pedobacter kyungheensis TaxID=1069985 RepID=A0A0C1FNX7_9SPHI|nr:hypothetical protein [Pedobacter kyungheensis]KIA93408.1 hypothetical protein OC25_13330 [Pedobacter kyungheensis]